MSPAASTSVASRKEETVIRGSADGLEILGGLLAAALIRHQVELDLLALRQMVEAGPFDGADMDEGVLAAVVRQDEAKALGRVKPLHGSHRHEENPFTAYLLKKCMATGCGAEG